MRRTGANSGGASGTYLQKELFTLPEVSVILSLSERTVEALIAKGNLRSAVAPGTDRSRRVSRTMIEEYLAEFNSQNKRRS